jgi:hypothetical protein
MKTRFDKTGRCTLCIGGNLCKPCQADGVKRDRERWAMLRAVSAQQAQDRVYRCCARYELESDEMQSREDKARAIIANFEVLK